MNIILFTQNEITDGISCRITGRRFDHIKRHIKGSVGYRTRIGVIDGLIGVGEIIDIDNCSFVMRIELGISPPEALPTTLIMALPRPKAFRRIIEAATSIGIKRIAVINSSNVEKSYWASPFLSNEALIERSILGLEQAIDTVLPKITLHASFERFISDELDILIRATKPYIAVPHANTTADYCNSTSTTICIGPDKGFTPYELDRFIDKKFIPFSLGKRILKVEQAVAMAIGKIVA